MVREFPRAQRFISVRRYDLNMWAEVTTEYDIPLDATDEEIIAFVSSFKHCRHISLEVHEANGDVRLYDGERFRYIVGVSEKAVAAMFAE